MMGVKRWQVFAAALAIIALSLGLSSGGDDSSADVHVPQPLVPFDSAWVQSDADNYRTPVDVIGEPQLVYVAPGQTLTSLLVQEGISAQQIALLAMAARPVINLGRLQIGTPIEITYIAPGQPRVRLAREYGEVVEAIYSDSGWTIKKHQLPTRSTTEETAVTIERSLYQDAVENGLPVSMVNSSIMALSHFVDFQRQIQPGDIFEARYERYQVVRDKQLFAHLAHPLRLTYLRFTNDGEDYRLYRFDGTFYFDDGRVAQSFLLKTPLNGARLSSHYGNRYHPVLGYNRLHKGIDFSAPVGTPIMAAGRGTIKHAGRKGSFGNAVIIGHADGYETLYAHLNGFADGLSEGDRVNQGDVIGYLGNTGLSAGRHLHYEVHRYGRSINPLSIKAPSNRRLEGAELARFKRYLAQLRQDGSELEGLAP